MKLPALEFGKAGARPVVLVHGLFGQGKNLAGIARALMSERHVFAVDLRNHGDAPWDDRHDYPALAADLYESFADFGEIDILGHSMGGKAAMRLALEHPEFVNRLFVADIAPVKYNHDHRGRIDAMLGLDLSQVKSRRDADALLAPSIPDDGERAFLLHSLEIKPEPRWRNNLVALKANMDNIVDWPEIASEFDGKTVFLGGANSDYIESAHRAKIKSLFPNAHISHLKNTGHWLHAESPQIFNKIAGDFFAI